MKTQHLLYIITVGMGLIIGLLINRQDPAEFNAGQFSPTTSSGEAISQAPAASLQGLQQDVAQLKLALAEEQKKRQSLAAQVKILRGTGGDTTTADSSEPTSSDTQEPGDKTIRVTSRPRINPGTDGWINAELLISAGVNELDVKRITDTFERAEMDKLYLRDRALREGWTGTPRFRDEMSKLNKQTEDLREQLSEHDYDAFLFATGKPNRVIVKSALSNSPAALAGIKPGDTIYKYNNVRVYTWADLRQETAKGNPDELVPVQILRDDKKMEMFIKRGPLGIRLDHLSLNPAG